MKIRSDLHIHTSASTCCHDARQTFETIVEFLKGKGLEKIGFSDHVWVSDKYEASDFYKKQSGEAHLKLKDLAGRHNWGIEILAGCEADMIAPGKFGMIEDFKRQMDYIILASDHFHMKSFVEQPACVSPEALGRHMLSFFISAAKSGIGDILAHPLFPYGFTDLYDAALLAISDAELFDACSIASSKNTAIEINPCYFPNENKKRFFSIETPVRFLTIAKEAGCKFTFGSDAHCIEDFSQLERLEYFADILKLQETDIHSLAKTKSER